MPIKLALGDDESYIGFLRGLRFLRHARLALLGLALSFALALGAALAFSLGHERVGSTLLIAWLGLASATALLVIGLASAGYVNLVRHVTQDAAVLRKARLALASWIAALIVPALLSVLLAQTGSFVERLLVGSLICAALWQHLAALRLLLGTLLRRLGVPRSESWFAILAGLLAAVLLSGVAAEAGSTRVSLLAVLIFAVMLADELGRFRRVERALAGRAGEA
ncbi:MAG TPA: hypothetical protein PKC43_03860 [Phycisphaerales bacterium]|nr:hypothetical protein [Phycisphaerales bacterium]HMP36562.1 hypothetical protein [Phycisphaerales bacterium]